MALAGTGRPGNPGRGAALSDAERGIRKDLLRGCAAPTVQLRFTPVGLVYPCCRTLRPLGHIANERLTDIWRGSQRLELVDRLGGGDYSMGCQPCELEVRAEGWEASYAAVHEEFRPKAGGRIDAPEWPTRFDFNLSNSCNLQCVQCDGDSSSSIRIHREHRAPLPKVYGDEFFEDLREFLPHLESATFAGGEPLLGEENYRVWELIAELAPDLPCSVVTNATQWSPRIESLLERLAMSVIVSLDGIARATYESIRVGASFEQVMENIDRLLDYTRRRGTQFTINHCLMPSNYHEFGDLLTWAERRQVRVDVSVVRHPAHSAIGELPIDQIRLICAELERQQPNVLPGLVINRTTWTTEVARIRSWAEDVESSVGIDRGSRMVLWFRCAGSGPTDTAGASSELAEFAGDGIVHEVVVGQDDLVARCSPALLDDPSELVAEGYHMLAKVFSERYGTMRHYQVLETTDDRMDIRAVWGSTECRMIGVPLRDERGRAAEASILIAFRPLGERDVASGRAKVGTDRAGR